VRPEPAPEHRPDFAVCCPGRLASQPSAAPRRRPRGKRARTARPHERALKAAASTSGCWRARFFKTRALACRWWSEGRVRLTRSSGEYARLDKGSRTVRPGDHLVFAIGGRVHDVRVLGLGERRGPAEEARALYAALQPEGGDVDTNTPDRHRDGPKPPHNQ
jgi:ribosome-associated heat shock protein Hsp15